MDLFVDDLTDYVVIVEIKGTNWDRIKPQNVKKLLGRTDGRCGSISTNSWKEKRVPMFARV